MSAEYPQPPSRLPMLTLGAGAAALAAFGLSRLSRWRARTEGPSCPLRSPLANAVLAGGEEVECLPWDTGTGVVGFRWNAPRPVGVVLLQHGFGEYSERYVGSYAGFVPRLLAAGLSVHAVDLPGHGRSPGRRVLLHTERAVAEHMAARDALRDQPLPVVLFGHSLGGLVTAASVARDQTGTEAVVLSSAFLGGPYSRVALAVGALLSRSVPAMPLVRLRPERTSRLSHKVAEVMGDPRMWRGPMPVLNAVTMAFAARSLPARYADWTLPTLLVHGTADTHTDHAYSEGLLSAIASTDKRLVRVDGGMHELFNDRGGEELAAATVEWIVERARRAGASSPVRRTACG